MFPRGGGSRNPYVGAGGYPRQGELHLKFYWEKFLGDSLRQNRIPSTTMDSETLHNMASIASVLYVARVFALGVWGVVRKIKKSSFKRARIDSSDIKKASVFHVKQFHEHSGGLRTSSKNLRTCLTGNIELWGQALQKKSKFWGYFPQESAISILKKPSDLRFSQPGS